MLTLFISCLLHLASPIPTASEASLPVPDPAIGGPPLRGHTPPPAISASAARSGPRVRVGPWPTHPVSRAKRAPFPLPTTRLLNPASPLSSERSSRLVHVSALPHLNVRSADRSRIVGELGDGEAIAAGRLVGTGERATVGGLEGEWLALDDSLRVFDAFLWVADPPRESEDFMDYGLRVVDGMDVVRFYSCNEDYGGPSGFHYGIDVRCTKGQALNFFRRMLRGMYAEERLRWAEEDSREQWWRIMEKGWNGEEALWFGWGSEGGGHSFMLRESDVTPGAFCIEWSGGTC